MNDKTITYTNEYCTTADAVMLRGRTKKKLRYLDRSCRVEGEAGALDVA